MDKRFEEMLAAAKKELENRSIGKYSQIICYEMDGELFYIFYENAMNYWNMELVYLFYRALDHKHLTRILCMWVDGHRLDVPNREIRKWISAFCLGADEVPILLGGKDGYVEKKFGEVR